MPCRESSLGAAVPLTRQVHGGFYAALGREARMALNVSAWSIRQPLPSIVMAIVITLLGWISFVKLPITRLPNVDIPVIAVTVIQFGASPAELESQVTKPIEDAVSGVEGVRH